MSDKKQPDGSENQTEQDSTESPAENPAVDERAPEWALPTDDEGEPDYGAAIEQIGLEHDRIFRIGSEFYRYRGQRGDDAVVAPQSRYSDVNEDCLPIATIWAAFHEGRVGHGPAYTGPGLVQDVSNVGGNSRIRVGPGESPDQNGQLTFENVPEDGVACFDYFSGEDLPRLRLYDATDREEPAFDFILPTEKHPQVHLLHDPVSYLMESLPDDLAERIDLDIENHRSYSPR